MLKTLSFILFCTNTLKHAVFIFFTEKRGEKAQREFIGWSDSSKVTKQVKARTEWDPGLGFLSFDHTE